MDQFLHVPKVEPYFLKCSYHAGALLGRYIVKSDYAVVREMRETEKELSHYSLIGVLTIDENYVESFIFEKGREFRVGGITYVKRSV
jgi:hypothetical protein